MWANPSWTNVPGHTTNFRSENFHLKHLFWTLPEQLSMLHHACEPTHPEPTSHDTLQTSDPKIFISHIPVLNFAGTDYTSHVCQPWTNVPRYTTKPQTPRCSSHTSVFWTLPEQLAILYTPRMCANPEPTFQRYTTTPQTVRFSSHTSVLNFAAAALHVTPRMWANPSWTNIPRHTTNFRSENFHLTHPCFELCRNNPEQITPRMCANPEPTFQRHTTKPQTLRFSSHTSVLNLAGTALHVTPRMWANPSWITSHDTLQTSDPKIFISHIPVLNFAGTDYTSHVCQPWTNVPKVHHKTSDPKMFISHIRVLNFAGAARHIIYTTHVCQPWTNVPKIHHNTSDRKMFISHICFELCRSSSPCYTTHVSQPILNQRPKTHYKLQIRKFSSHTSLFWTLPEQITRMCANPEPTFQRYTTRPQTQRSSSHTSVFWTLPEQLSILHHTCGPTHREPTSQETLQTSDPNFVISHICFELCRNSSPCYTTHVSQPILNQRPKTHYKLQIRKFSSHTSLFWTLLEQPGTDYTTHVCQPILNQRSKDTSQNLRPQDFHLTPPSLELCRSSSPCYTTHVSQPILNQRPKTHYKLQVRFFSSHPSLFWTLPE